MIVVPTPERGEFESALSEDSSSFRTRAPHSETLLSNASVRIGSKDRTVDVEASDAPRSAPTQEILSRIVERSRRTSRRFPHSVNAKRNLGLALVHAGQAEEAVSTLSDAHDSSDRPTRLTLASALAAQGDLAGAEALYLGLRAESPRDPLICARLAEVALSAGRLTDAAEWWSTALALDPDRPGYHYWLGIVLLASQPRRTNDAIHHLRVATRLDVRSAALHTGLGVAYAVAGDADRAEAAFRRAMALQPELSGAAEGLVALFIARRRIDDALNVAQRLVEVEPGAARSHELLARVWFAFRRYQDARTELLRALQMVPPELPASDGVRSRLLNNVGVCLCHLGDISQGRLFFNQAIEAKPDAARDARLNLARVWMAMGRPEAAVAVAQECRRRHSDDEGAHLLTATALNEAGQTDAACQIIRDWISGGHATGNAYANLGAINLDYGRDLDAAVDVLRSGLERFPDHKSIRNNLAYAFLSQGDVSDARSILDSTDDEDSPTGIALTATRGLLKLWEGDLEEGRRLYEQAERAARADDPYYADQVAQKAHLEIAKALVRLGDRDEAFSQAEAGLSLRGRRGSRYELEALMAALKTSPAQLSDQPPRPSD